MLVPLIAQLATAVGATPAYQDSENILWRKIAVVLEAPVAYSDNTETLLNKIRGVFNATPGFEQLSANGDPLRTVDGELLFVRLT